MANNIIQAVLDYRYVDTRSVWQYDYGQILRIQGENLPKAVEVHFSLNEVGGDSITKIGVTTDGITEVQVPDELLENGGARFKYSIYAFVYTEDGASGNTEYRVRIPVQVRPKPSDHVTPDNTDIDPFGDVVKAVNNAAERAEASEQKAKEHAARASESAVTAEKTKEDALRKVGEKKQEAIEAIQNQEETSVGKITTHTDGEIQRIQNQTVESKGELEQTITNADASKKELEHSIETAGTSKTALDKSVELAGTAKTELDTSIREAGTAKTALDDSTETAGTVQETLSATVNQAGALDTSLGEKIKTGTQLKTDLVASGEKAVQDIQAAGSEQLGKMQAVAEAFTADREQIATNKKDIGSLKEDLSNKITKFYASNQGETHITDSDNGKIQDMIIYGRSSRFTTTGKNLLKYPYVEADKTSLGITFKDNKDGSINVSGTATETVYYNLYSNVDGKRLMLAIGTYKLVVKGRSKCNVFINNGVSSAQNEGTFTITDGNNEAWCFIQVLKGVTVNETIYPMIQLASITDESYEPYTGGIPSPSPDYPQEIKSVVNPVIKVCEANILNIKNINETVNNNNGLTYSVKNGVIKVKGTATSNVGIGLTLKTASGSLELKKNNTYIFNPNPKKVEDNNVYLDLTNSRSLGISLKSNNINKPIKITENDAKYPFSLYVRVKQGATIDMEWKPQLLLNESLLPYKPYTEQSVTLPVTLNAIPVSSGGNVIIDGKQYIADRVVEKDGVFGIERNIREIHTNTKTMNNSEEYPGWNKVEGISDDIYYNENPVGDSRKLTFISNFTQYSFLQNNKGTNNILYYIRHIIGYSQSELIAKAIDVDMYIRLQDAIFEPLPGDIQAKLRTLVTNYSVTNISVTSDQLDGYTVFNYPISMANGWNYVKQQIGDTRDYIYDMDLQSAEAYVNSEYAVALTELEVM